MSNSLTAQLPVVDFPKSSMFGLPALSPEIQKGRDNTKVIQATSPKGVLLVVGVLIALGFGLHYLNER